MRLLLLLIRRLLWLLLLLVRLWLLRCLLRRLGYSPGSLARLGCVRKWGSAS